MLCLHYQYTTGKMSPLYHWNGGASSPVSRGTTTGSTTNSTTTGTTRNAFPGRSTFDYRYHHQILEVDLNVILGMVGRWVGG